MKRRSLRNILVPVDFSPLSTRAIEVARELGRRFGGMVHLVHVHEYYYPVGFMAPGAPVPISLSTFQEGAEERVTAKFRALAKCFGISPAHCYLEHDAPVFHQICKVAQRMKADLIVTPTHGYTGLTHFFEGSTAERIVQHAPCPVYVAKPNSRRGVTAAAAEKSLHLDRIMVPVDFSECSFAGLQYALSLANQFGARLVLFNAVHLGYAYTADGYGMYDLAKLQEVALRDAERQMREFVHRARCGAVPCETKVEIVPPVDGICAFAEDQDVDLIVMATHGRTGFKHVLMGSTAEQVVRRARRPLLVIPSHPSARVAALIGPGQPARISCGVSKSGARRGRRQPGSPLTRRDRKIIAHAPVERRKTNKFRESHEAIRGPGKAAHRAQTN